MKNKVKRNENIVEHFTKRSMQYDNISLWVTNETILKRMLDFLPEDNKKYKILDLGAGTGAVSKYILNNYKKDVEITAVDNCLSMLEKIDEQQIQIVESDVARMPFPDHSFDVVISRQCLHYVENLDEAMSEVRRVMKKDGVFILGQIVPYDSVTAQYWNEITQIRQPFRKWYFTAEQWNQKLAQNNFKILNKSICVHQGSVNMWIKKYNITEYSLIEKYKRLLLEADYHYKQIYSVQENEDDVTYNAYWHIVKSIAF